MPYRSRDDLTSHVLTKEQVSELADMYYSGHKIQDIAKHFGIHRNTVHNIMSRVRKDKQHGKYS